MAVYEGVLEKISRREEISTRGRGGYRTASGKYRETGRDIQAGWIRHQFVDIGGTRIRTVVLRRYHDELLEEAIGEEVALSITGPAPDSEKRHTVVAIRTPKGGVSKPTKGQLWFVSIVWMFKYFVASVFLTLLFLLLALVALFFSSSLFWVGVVVAVLVGVFWMFTGFVSMRKMFRAAAAL